MRKISNTIDTKLKTRSQQATARDDLIRQYLAGKFGTPHRDFDPHSQEHVQWLAQLAMRKKEEERNSQRKGGKDDREEYGNEFGREFGREFGNEHGREYGTEFGREFGMKPDRDGMSKAEFV